MWRQCPITSSSASLSNRVCNSSRYARSVVVAMNAHQLPVGPHNPRLSHYATYTRIMQEASTLYFRTTQRGTKALRFARLLYACVQVAKMKNREHPNASLSYFLAKDLIVAVHNNCLFSLA